jgi:sugar O-acyltransferase (sialic acid O-acetyltransferase NeuD family)
MRDIILVGGGGHCKSVIDSLNRLNQYNIRGIIDREENLGKIISGYKVIGTDNDLEKLFSQGIKYAFITLGSIGNPTIRIKLYNLCKSISFTIPKIIDSTAIISDNADIGFGTFVAKGVIINSDTVIGENAIINTGSIIEHDCRIGNNVHISPGVTVGGSVSVGINSHIGIGSTIIQNISIGRNVIIGSSSNVIRDISDNIKAYGNPCKGV